MKESPHFPGTEVSQVFAPIAELRNGYSTATATAIVESTVTATAINMGPFFLGQPAVGSL